MPAADEPAAMQATSVQSVVAPPVGSQPGEAQPEAAEALPLPATLLQRWLAPVLPEPLPELDVPVFFTELETAQELIFRGRYRTALYALDAKNPAAGDPSYAQVALLRAEALLALGKYDEAAGLLAPLATPEARLLRAELAETRGDYPAALAEVRQVLSDVSTDEPRHAVARFELGRLLEASGDVPAAEEAYAWFTEPPVDYLARWQNRGPEAFASAAELTAAARGIDRWARLTQSYRQLPQLNEVVLDMLVSAYDVVDRTYWPARLAAGEYLLAHDNREDAMQALAAAVAANPNDADLLETLGRVQVNQFGFTEAEQIVAMLRGTNPTSLRADVLEARLMLGLRSPDLAEPLLLSVLERQPEHLEALGLLAATHAVRLEDAAAAEVLARADAVAPNDARALFEVAEQLAALRQYDRAQAMYDRTIERAPWWTQPRTELALMLTQAGDEMNPYSMRTVNYLRLLDEMEQFERLETDHFIILYEEDTDPILPELFADYLESIHPEMVEIFDHEPAVKTQIQLMPRHDMFSVRTTGSPWIGTVGACTGPVIAMVVPRDAPQTFGTFNWANVVRHEYVHTVTLSVTENRIPHWMTEGLAVLYEDAPLPWSWVPMLHWAVTNDELFPMEDLTWGFVRPRRPFDRSLAYAQSNWVCLYIRDTWGQDAINTMLRDFAAGRQIEGVFRERLGLPLAEFDSRFNAWAVEQIAGWGYDEQTTEEYDALVQKAAAQVRARAFAEAAASFEAAHALRPMDPLPRQRLAGLYLTRDLRDEARAIDHLKALHFATQDDARYAKQISKLYTEMNDPAQAVRFAREAIYVAPYDEAAYTMLAAAQTAAGDTAAAERTEGWLQTLRDRAE